jgi:hypothetical protein
MAHRAQPRLSWSAILGGVLIASGHLQANGLGEPAGTGAGNGNGVTVAAAAAGGAHGSGGERSGAPAEVSRAAQPAAASRTREAAVQNGGNQPAAVRGAETAANAREAIASSGDGATRRYVIRYGNAWTDPVAGGQQQQQRYYRGYQNNGGQAGYRRHSRPYPYLYQYYGGYYPIYVDVPVVGDYIDGDAAVNSGYDGGPAVVPDPGVSPVIPPSTITVSPQDNNAQPSADAANPGQDAAQAGNPAPNPAIGPDSLVEAVQAELTRRGYYQGKVDAMFRRDTEEALRHFQQDNYLAPTGHLNEPTLHALNLD